MMKSKLITLALAFSFLTFPVVAQEKVDSEIVMTKEELKSFLKAVAEAKRESLRNKKSSNREKSSPSVEIDDSKSRLNADNRDNQRQRHHREENRGDYVSNAELLRELDRLHNRLFFMGLTPNAANQGTTTVVRPGNNNSPVVNSELLEARAKLDSLEKAAAQNNLVDSNSSYVSELDKINQQLDALNAGNISVDQLRAKFKNFKKTIYFAHDSEAITADALSEIKAVASLLDDNERINVLVKGFASKVGNPVYNNDLSMRRTQAVKTALVSQGVGIDQIITIFHGEDFTTSDADARRVDMTLQVVR